MRLGKRIYVQTENVRNYNFMRKDLYTKSLTPSSSLVELDWLRFGRFNTIFEIQMS